MAWNKCNTKSDVQPLAYDSVRDTTGLGSQHAILATHQAAEAITGCIERRTNGKKASKPRFTAPTVTYDTRTMTLFDDDTVSLSTTESRVRCSLSLPNDDDGYQRQYLNSDEWQVTESTLTARDGEYFLHIGFRRYRTDAERDTAEDGTILGLTLASKTSLSRVQHAFSPGGSYCTISESSSRCVAVSNKPGREVHTGHLLIRVSANSATFET